MPGDAERTGLCTPDTQESFPFGLILPFRPAGPSFPTLVKTSLANQESLNFGSPSTMSVIVAFLDYGGILRTTHDPLLSSGGFPFRLVQAYHRRAEWVTTCLFPDFICSVRTSRRFYMITTGAIPCEVCLSSFNPSTNTRKSHQSIKTFYYTLFSHSCLTSATKPHKKPQNRVLLI